MRAGPSPRPARSRRIALVLALLGCGPDAGTEPAEPPGDSAEPTPAPEPDPACSLPGCLRSATLLGRYPRDELQALVDPEVRVENGYAVWIVEYASEAGPVTGTFTLPEDLQQDAPAAGFPVVVNAHGTVGLDDPCRLSGTVSGSGLAGLFGARGAIGVAPDYPGLGTPGWHHYLEARSEATSVLDAIRAALALASWQQTPSSGRAAVVGLSQGGHAALAAATWHSRYAPELDIRAFGASGPASVWAEHWAGGVELPGPHLVMHALLTWSFADAAGASRDGIWAEPLAARVDEHLTTRCYWSPAFGAEPLLSDDFPTRPGEVFTDEFRAAFATGDWGDWAFLGEAFAANRVGPWLDEGEQTAPIAVWQGSADTTVPAWMTAELVAALQAGGVDVTLHEVPGGTHTTTAFGFLATPERATDASVAWVQAQLAAD